MSDLRLLIVGLGQRGQQWLEFCHGHDGAEVVAGADPDPTARNLARTYLSGPECRLFPTLEFALRACEADAAIVCTPVPDHRDTCLACLEAGLAVMVEKLFAETMAGGKETVAGAEARGLPLVVAQNYRFSNLELTVRNAIRDGLIGKPGFVHCLSHRHRPAGETFQRTVRFAQLDMAVHHFDNFRAQLGCNAAAVQARALNPGWSDYQHGSVVHALIEMEGGVEISYAGSFVSHTNAFHERIEGSEGALEITGERVVRRSGPGARPEPVPPGQGLDPDRVGAGRRGMRGLLADLEAAVREGREPETSGRDNLQTLAMVAACMRSSDEGRRVTIDEVLSD